MGKLRGTRVSGRKKPKSDTVPAAPAEASGSRAGGPAAAAAPGPAAPRPVRGAGVKGLGLGTKFAALVAGLIAAVVLIWGWTISGLVQDSMEQQIILKGRDTLKAIAIYGRLLIEGRPGANTNDLKRLGAEQTDLFDVIIEHKDETGRMIRYTMRGEEYSIPKERDSIDMDLGPGIAIERYQIVRGRRTGVPVIDIKNYPVKNPEGQVLGFVRVLINAERVEGTLGNLWGRMVGAGLVFLVLGVGASFFLGAQVAKPAKMLMEDMERIAKGDYEHEARATSGDEIGRLAGQFNYMTWAIRELRAQEKERERLTSELDTAREIQANLLPNKIPQLPGFDIFPFYRSAKEVGGDYYDFFPVDRERLAMVVADVSGKGIPGSMVMASTRTILRILGPQCATVAELLRQTNRLVAKDIKRGMFVTAIFAILNVRTKEMAVCSAGHNPMTLYRERTAQVELVNPNGIALGFDAGPIFDRTLQESEARLEPGDRVVMYTDGVVEAMDPNGDEYGDDRFYAFVRNHARMRSRDFVQAAIKDLDAHKGTADQHDDITIVTFRVLA